MYTIENTLESLLMNRSVGKSVVLLNYVCRKLIKFASIFINLEITCHKKCYK